MIRQIKTGIKLLPYAHGTGVSVTVGMLMLLLGCVMCLLGRGYSAYLGVYFIISVAMWPLQLLYSLGVPNMIQTSPWKKKLQTSVSSLLSFLGFLIANLLVCIFQWIPLQDHMMSESMASGIMLMGSITSVVIMLYMGAALKYFIVSTIGYMMLMIPLLTVVRAIDFEGFPLPFAGSILISVLLILLGALLQYGLTYLVYRAPIAKNVQFSSALRKML